MQALAPIDLSFLMKYIRMGGTRPGSCGRGSNVDDDVVAEAPRPNRKPA